MLGPVVQVRNKLKSMAEKQIFVSRGPSIKTHVGEAERKDKPASLAVHLDQAQGAPALSLQNLEDQEDQEEEIRSWMGTSDSSFHQEEVALATGEGRGKHLLRLTSTTGK